MSTLKLAVVMPYYKNERTLTRSLNALLAQNCAELAEIIVVDDGGPVRAKDVVAQRPLNSMLQVFETKNLGQSGATNRGIEASRADIVVLICADIIARPDFLDAHLRAHRQFGERVAVCGHIAYAPWLPMTPFMRYLEEPNVQFDFRSVKNPDCVSAGMFYAPNVSVRREDLLRAGLFNEKLVYGFQDVDLGIRIASQGTRIVYRENARVLHDHPNSPNQFFERQVRVGRMLPHFLSSHPNNAIGRRFVQTLERTLHILPQAPELLAQMRQIEARAQAIPHHFEQLKASLFNFYHIVMLLGFVKGALETGDILRDLLGVSAERWQRCRSLIQDFSVSEGGAPLAQQSHRLTVPSASPQAPAP